MSLFKWPFGKTYAEFDQARRQQEPRDPTGRTMTQYDGMCGRGHGFQWTASKWFNDQLEARGLIQGTPCPFCPLPAPVQEQRGEQEP